MNRIRFFLCFSLFAAMAIAVHAGGLPALASADAAVGEAEAGDVDAAALVLSAGNLAGKGTLAWYHQSALVLLNRAEELKVAGEYISAQKTAAAAIRILARGDSKGAATAASADRAQLYVQLGMAYDHFFGDHASARKYFMAALQLEPDLASAKAALAAYDAEAARLQRLQGGGK